MRCATVVPLALAVMLSVSACGGGGGTGAGDGTGPDGVANGGGAGTTDTATATGDVAAPEALVGAFETLAADIEAAQGDCGAVATALSSWSDANQARLPELQAEVDTMTIADDDLAALETRLETGIIAVFEATAECGDHDGAVAAFEQFEALIDSM